MKVARSHGTVTIEPWHIFIAPVRSRYGLMDAVDMENMACKCGFYWTLVSPIHTSSLTLIERVRPSRCHKEWVDDICHLATPAQHGKGARENHVWVGDTE